MKSKTIVPAIAIPLPMPAPTHHAALTALQYAPTVVSMKKPQSIQLRHEKENERISEDLKLTKLNQQLQAVQQQQRLFAQAT